MSQSANCSLSEGATLSFGKEVLFHYQALSLDAIAVRLEAIALRGHPV